MVQSGFSLLQHCQQWLLAWFKSLVYMCSKKKIAQLLDISQKISYFYLRVLYIYIEYVDIIIFIVLYLSLIYL